MFTTWLYVSTSTLEVKNASAEVDLIQIAALTRNPELGLTGVLIFSGRHFAQFLEGPGAGLEIMKARIVTMVDKVMPVGTTEVHASRV